MSDGVIRFRGGEVERFEVLAVIFEHFIYQKVVDRATGLKADCFSLMVPCLPIRLARILSDEDVEVQRLDPDQGPEPVQDQKQELPTAAAVVNIPVDMDMEKYKVKVLFNPLNHAQSNPTERSNRTIKTMIRSHLKDDHRQWDAHLSELTCAINTAKHKLSIALRYVYRNKKPSTACISAKQENFITKWDPNTKYCSTIKKFAGYQEDKFLKRLFELRVEVSIFLKDKESALYKILD
ncbi:hypothetical protein CBL_12142 [Carabus blaptoides fortunei]